MSISEEEKFTEAVEAMRSLADALALTNLDIESLPPEIQAEGIKKVGELASSYFQNCVDGLSATDSQHILRKERRIRQIGRDNTRFVIGKNRKYGDSVRKSVEKLKADFPDGIRPEQYADLLLWIRVQDKLTRLATYTPDRRAEDDESPWVDIMGYGILGCEKDLPEHVVGFEEGEETI